MGIEYTGVLGLIILALDVWAIITVFRSDATTSGKLLWSLLIVILPVVGLIVWFMAGPRQQGLSPEPSHFIHSACGKRRKHSLLWLLSAFGVLGSLERIHIGR